MQHFTLLFTIVYIYLSLRSLLILLFVFAYLELKIETLNNLYHKNV